MKIVSDHSSESFNPHLRQASVILYRHVNFWGEDPAEILIFYRDSSTFRANLIFPTQPSTLNISAPFAIGGLSVKRMYSFDLFMTHTKPQLPTHRNHLVTASQSQAYRGYSIQTRSAAWVPSLGY
jgi:hypothetical protein